MSPRGTSFFCRRRLTGREFYGTLNKGVGRQVTGYYDPKRPDLIREDKPRKPLLGGGIFFVFAAFCLLAEILLIWEMIMYGLYLIA